MILSPLDNFKEQSDYWRKNFSQIYLVAQINLISIGQLQREVRLLKNRVSHSLIHPVAKKWWYFSICNSSALCDHIIVILSNLILSRQVRLSEKSAQIDHIYIVMHQLFVILSLKTGRKTCDREIYSTYKLIIEMHLLFVILWSKTCDWEIYSTSIICLQSTSNFDISVKAVTIIQFECTLNRETTSKMNFLPHGFRKQLYNCILSIYRYLICLSV